MFVSYAQNFEDVILWRALKHVEGGFYIDVGAQDPVVDSVSKAFYERGWRGIHAEPSAAYAAKLRADRPDEVVVEAAIGSGDGALPFFEFPETGLSTGDPAVARMHEERGLAVVETAVPRKPLSALFDEAGERPIHWLKIDVEGMEKDVVESWSPSSARPWLVVMESTLPNSSEAAFADWEPSLVALGYQFAYFDGLNRFYVHEDHLDLLAVFGPGPNVFDDFVLYGNSSFTALLNQRILDHHNAALHVQSELGIRTSERDLAGQRAATLSAALADRDASLGRLEIEVASRTAAQEQVESQLAELRNAVAERESTIGQLKIEEASRTAALAEAEARLAALQSEFADASARLKHAEDERISLSAAFARAQENVGELTSQLSVKEAEVSQLKIEEASRRAALAEAEGRLAERTGELGEAQKLNKALETEKASTASRLTAARKNAERLTLEVQKKTARLKATESALENKATLVGQVLRQIDVVGSANAELTTAVDSLQARLNASERRRHDELAAANAQIRALSAVVERVSGDLSAVHASTSWRVTKPLRGVGHAAKAVTAPKESLRRAAEHGLVWLNGRPKVRHWAVSLLRVVPPLDRRLRQFATVRGYGAALPQPPAQPVWALDCAPESLSEWQRLVSGASRTLKGKRRA
ncbi:MAG: FkbM family methyltransferase [Phreatobacter sp.]|uniref:FkbM family methyltransferase n=1 Tax=Phreatobacter sp. TaxID=1966341 RepID=UPI00403734FC